MPALPRRADRARQGDHMIVCGDGPLAYRITEELTSRYDEVVTVILPDRKRRNGPQISALRNVRVKEHPELNDDAFRDADIRTARAVAIIWQNDVGNFHAGLRAAELNQGIRLVLAIFNRSLGDHIRLLFPDCTVLSGTAMSAPSFVAAALGEPAPSHVRMQRRTLYLAHREDVDPAHILCGLETSADDATSPRLVGPDAPGPDLVLAVADGTPRDPLARRRDPFRATLSVLKRLIWHKFGIMFTTLLTVIIVGFILLLKARYSVADDAYLTLMDLTGSALTDPAKSGAEKTSQVLLTLDGMAAIPVVTALVVGARLTGRVRGAPRPPGDHVIVVGLGNVGTSVIGQLHDLGYAVVCIDSREDAAGIPLARQLGLPVIIGDATRQATLREAGLDTCLSLVSVTSVDVVNLETALTARGLRDDMRIVLRVADDDLAERLQKSIGNTVSRSVPYLAAPAFAAAMLEHQVLRTIAVGRHVLLMADIIVADQQGLAGRAVEQTENGGQSRILAVQTAGAPDLDWSPSGRYRLAAGDRLIVLATRHGLRHFLS